ncbi:nuclear receptor subfamily 5 group A member 2-like isoform X3 [Xiphophorus maculatus]|uniref:nuclear receptor subfamily 5 group A member 2-like isoform X3 n=1 Tax=Xiphophorus maculatus TaxID=8083 RepID=UPI000C6D4504|nr:nuclear receptor subfamily 5 group A member 2-like isoform X3 [Xiphophorus maculatus]
MASSLARAVRDFSKELFKTTKHISVWKTSSAKLIQVKEKDALFADFRSALMLECGWKQEQACRHREANTFSSVCVMADQLLCSIVEWARTSIFFKELKVSDQMRLLHSCWSELLVLEIISRQVLYGIDGSLLLITGQQGELSYVASHAGSALVSLNQRGTELVEKLRMLKVDHQEFACIRFLILFAPDVKELEEHHFVESVQQQVEGALLKYTLTSSSQSCNRFTCLQLYLSELRSLSILAEDYLYYKHLSGEVPCNNLLNEMLHAKCCWT